ncbi:hypothetical protein ACIQYL_18260 [Lysinibacillus xylanilyticus]|uniref:hypothetical protein n=1 Tax=Lysinibacillus xylanilyticus TaxID=582475 RepID=UPI0038155A86
MKMHGEVRNAYELEYLVKNETPDKTAKVIELSRLETYIMKEVYCARCEEWKEIDSRDFITGIVCPDCCTNWE